MTAFVDKFANRKPSASNLGSESSSLENFNNSSAGSDSKILRIPQKDTEKLSWIVCHHLSTSGKVARYYKDSGLIMLVLGKCLCHECCATIVSAKDLNGILDGGRKLTDEGFQKNVIVPLILTNRMAFRSKVYMWATESTEWTWIGCPHVSNEEKLEELYSSCKPLFFHEGFVTCDECIEAIPTADIFMQAMLDCESMKDEHFQSKIINQLYPLNIDMLGYVRQYQSKIQRMSKKFYRS
jgi:hypothetical protein